MMKRITTLLLLPAVLLMASCGGDDGLTVGNSGADQDEDGTTATVDSNYVYQLPVIFHVLYQDANNAAQYIPASRLKNLLQYVNEIYQGGIYGESANVRLRFVLAEQDESGKTLATPGVEYIRYTGEYPIDESAFMTAQANARYIWDPNEYINVMLYPFKEQDGGTVLGLSHMPYTIKGDHALAGLETTAETYISKSRLGYPLCSSINSRYAAQASGGGYYQSDRYMAADHQASFISSVDVVVTLAHELGHYLGLYHVFTEAGNSTAAVDVFEPVDSCGDTDYCKDTPSYNRADYSRYLSSYAAGNSTMNVLDLLRRYACDTSSYYSANIMDYAFTLGFKISDEQRARIRNVLYYSPLIPGPKLNGANRRTRATTVGGTQLYTRPRLIR